MSRADVYRLRLDESYRPQGEPIRLTSDQRYIPSLDWAADGKYIVASSFFSPALWRVSIAGGTPERIAVAADQPASPAIRGRRLAYTRVESDSNVWRIQTSGRGEPSRLLGSTRMDGTLDYSPDGRRVVYCSAQSGATELWLAQSDGSNPEQLTSFGTRITCSPRWSPDGRQIVFDSNAEANQFEVYTIQPDGGRPRRLTNSGSGDYLPNFSRDGKWIYFSSNRNSRIEIWKLPANGGEPVQVTSNGGFVPFESSDGQAMFYQKLADGSLWRMPVAGGAETKVLDHVEQRNFLPVSSGIYFMRSESGASAFYFLSFSSGKEQRLGSATRPTNFGLSISSDGQWLAYSQRDQAGSDSSLAENFH